MSTAEGDSPAWKLAAEFVAEAEPATEECIQGSVYMPYKDIIEFKEMRPPDIMPHVSSILCPIGCSV